MDRNPESFLLAFFIHSGKLAAVNAQRCVGRSSLVRGVRSIEQSGGGRKKAAIQSGGNRKMLKKLSDSFHSLSKCLSYVIAGSQGNWLSPIGGTRCVSLIYVQRNEGVFVRENGMPLFGNVENPNASAVFQFG